MSIFKEPVKTEIKDQIDRRQLTMASDSRTPQQLTWLNSRNSWIRMSSAVNVNGSDTLAKSYILQGGTLTGFGGTLKSGLGTDFTNNAYSNQDVIGNSFRHGIRPMPGITGVEVKSRGAYGSLREATVSFQCWDIKQLEDLELLYMRPGYSVLVEWGWSPYLDNTGALVNTINPIDDVLLGTNTKEEIWNEIFKRNKDTNGNYDAVYGIVKNYSWKARTDGGYDCTTVLITMGEVLESLKVNYAASDTEVPQKGLFQADLAALGLGLTPFPNDSFLSKAHQQNIIAGMAAELQFIIRGLVGGAGNISKIIKIAGKDRVVATLNVDIKNAPPSLKNTAFKTPFQCYIALNDFLDLLNEFVLIEDTNSNKPYAAVSVREGSHMENPGRPLLCLANRYQVSTNPLVCLIDNNNYINPSDLGYSTSCTAIPDLMKGLVHGMDNTVSYFWNGAGSNSNEYGVIGNIYVNLSHIYSLAIDSDLENTDKKEKKDINLFDFLKNLMNGINISIGNMASFEIFVDPQDSIIRIIDINYVNPEPVANVISNAPTIELQNTLSTARNYSFESQIFPEQSTIVAIGAQTEGGPLAENVKTLIDFNKNLTDRIIPEKKVPTSKGASATDRQKNLANNFKILSEYFCQLKPSWWEISGDFDVDKASAYENALKDIINYVLENPNLGGLNNKAIIPTKLSIEMDGLGGFIIGNIFRINDDIVPRGYKGINAGVEIGYVITGINHSVRDSDWVTKIESQFIILEDPQPITNLSSPPTAAIVGSSDGATASANINVNSTVFLGSVKANYLLSIDQPSQSDVKVNFTHTLTLKDGKQLSKEVTGVIPAGSTSTVVSVEFSEKLEDVLTDNNAASFSNIGTTINNCDVISNTSYSFAENANEVTAPIPTTQQKPQKTCPPFPADSKTAVDLVIQALDKLKYSYSKKPYYLNVVGIRNTDKDFGISQKVSFPSSASPSNTTLRSAPLNPPSAPSPLLFSTLLPPATFPITSPSQHEGSALVQKGFLGEGKKGKPVVNTFTDWLVAWYYDDKGVRYEKVGKATTVPGKYYQSTKFWTERGINLGRNITLLEGHYTNFYVKGTHNKQFNTLIVNTSYTSSRPIYRIDRGLDSTYSFDGIWEGEIQNPKNPSQLISAKINNPYRTGLNGITAPSTNIHNSGDYQNNDPSKLVNDWSAGCQVWRNINEWKWMSDAVVLQINKTRKSTFDYSLLNIRDLPGFENCQDTVN